MSNTLTYNGEELPIIQCIKHNLIVLYKGEKRLYNTKKEQLVGGDDWKNYTRFKKTNGRINQ